MIKKLGLLAIIFVGIALFGYLLNIYKSPTERLRLQDLRRKITPEIKQCILQRLGEKEALKFTEMIKETKKISDEYLAKISPCFESESELTGYDTSPLLNKEMATNYPNIKLIGEGTIEGYNYWLYENEKYPCGKSGNYEFLVIQKGAKIDKRHLFVRFHGGAAGFYYNDGSSYWPEPKFAKQMLYADRERLNLLSAVLGDGLTKLIRENRQWRILAPSYCSHDFYIGKGQSNSVDGFSRWGYFASKDALDFTSSEFSTDKIVTTGTSAGASGAFYHGYQRKNVVGIMMDSFAGGFAAMNDACKSNIHPYYQGWPCVCNEKTCVEVLAERIGFNPGTDEPLLLINQGSVNTPIYLIWNKNDAVFNYENAHLQFDNLQMTIERKNPGGKSVAKEVCVDNPATPKRKCTIHSPTMYDLPETQEVYDWVISLVD